MIAQLFQAVSGLAVVAIGVFLVVSFPDMQTPPFCSGVAFIILGLNLWLKNCPLIHGLRGCRDGACASPK